MPHSTVLSIGCTGLNMQIVLILPFFIREPLEEVEMEKIGRNFVV